jgi:hypothetical protein
VFSFSLIKAEELWQKLLEKYVLAFFWSSRWTNFEGEKIPDSELSTQKAVPGYKAPLEKKIQRVLTFCFENLFWSYQDKKEPRVCSFLKLGTSVFENFFSFTLISLENKFRNLFNEWNMKRSVLRIKMVSKGIGAKFFSVVSKLIEYLFVYFVRICILYVMHMQ